MAAKPRFSKNVGPISNSVRFVISLSINGKILLQLRDYEVIKTVRVWPLSAFLTVTAVLSEKNRGWRIDDLIKTRCALRSLNPRFVITRSNTTIVLGIPIEVFEFALQLCTSQCYDTYRLCSLASVPLLYVTTMQIIKLVNKWGWWHLNRPTV